MLDFPDNLRKHIFLFVYSPVTFFPPAQCILIYSGYVRLGSEGYTCPSSIRRDHFLVPLSLGWNRLSLQDLEAHLVDCLNPC